MSNSLSMIVRQPRELEPHQKIALAVVAQAFADTCDQRLREEVRAEARTFITNSVMLHEWCAVAGFTPAFTRDVSGRFLRGFIRLVTSPDTANAAPPQRHPRERIVGRTARRVASDSPMQQQRLRQTACRTSRPPARVGGLS
jgi:hypothetical protein